ncbi:MAG: NUDIX hydrolase [Candidatus Omnitrophota bacterium]
MARKRIFSGKLIKFFTGKKRLPDGRDAYFEEIEHPGAALALATTGGKVVFIRQYRGVIGKYIWELPAGTIDRGETPYSCVKREITEETGYVAKKIKRIGTIYTSPGYSNEKIYIFKAECGQKKEVKTESDELLRVRLFTDKEIAKLFNSGKITDSKTIAALTLAGIL